MHRLISPPALAGVLALIALSAATVQGAGNPARAKDDAEPPAEYAKGLEHLEAEDFEAARSDFERAVRRAPRDADVLNMLAYAQRKTGQLDRAIRTYQKALKLRPRFPQAREYLAEAYLQAALRELSQLESYGDEARSERDQVIRALEQAASREAWGESGDAPGGAKQRQTW